MKTTLEVPDDLYALVKARAALEGRTLRAVMEELLKGWVAPRAQAGTAAQRHSGTDEERRTEGDEKGGRGNRGTREGAAKERQAKAGDPWESHRSHLRKIMLNPKSIDEIAGTLKEPGPDLDMEKAREAYMRDIADEWRRREAKGGRG